MEVKNLENFTIHKAPERLFVYSMARPTIDCFVNGLNNITYNRKDLIHDYAKKTNLEGYCMLVSHGGARLKKSLAFKDILKYKKNNVFEWVYIDDKQIYSVQNWVDEQDGKYLALFLDVCNPLNLDIHSQSSILLFPDSNYAFVQKESGEVRMFVPGLGYYNDVPQRKIGAMDFLLQMYRISRIELKKKK